MGIVPQYDKLRYQYEFGNRSIQDLCKEHGFLITELQEYASSNSWSKQKDVDLLSEDSVSDYYTVARRQLTVEMASRALVLWSRLTEIENGILDIAAQLVEDIQADPKSMLRNPLELSRLTKILSDIQASNKMYIEAVQTPAMHDKATKELSDILEEQRKWIVEVVHTNNANTNNEEIE